jgi:hypothetical protein
VAEVVLATEWVLRDTTWPHVENMEGGLEPALGFSQAPVRRG